MKSPDVMKRSEMAVRVNALVRCFYYIIIGYYGLNLLISRSFKTL